MLVLDDDRNHASPGTCENCGRSDVLVRPVQAVGWMGEPRGYHRICFECFAPRITWAKREGSATYVTPVYDWRGKNDD